MGRNIWNCPSPSLCPPPHCTSVTILAKWGGPACLPACLTQCWHPSSLPWQRQRLASHAAGVLLQQLTVQGRLRGRSEEKRFNWQEFQAFRQQYYHQTTELPAAEFLSYSRNFSHFLTQSFKIFFTTNRHVFVSRARLIHSTLSVPFSLLNIRFFSQVSPPKKINKQYSLRLYCWRYRIHL